MTQQLLYIVYLRSDEIVLTKKRYASWREIQGEYDDYMTSLGPWTATQTAQFIETEYPESPPFTHGQVESFMQSAHTVISSTETAGT